MATAEHGKRRKTGEPRFSRFTPERPKNKQRRTRAGRRTREARRRSHAPPCSCRLGAVHRREPVCPVRCRFEVGVMDRGGGPGRTTHHMKENLGRLSKPYDR